MYIFQVYFRDFPLKVSILGEPKRLVFLKRVYHQTAYGIIGIFG